MRRMSLPPVVPGEEIVKEGSASSPMGRNPAGLRAKRIRTITAYKIQDHRFGNQASGSGERLKPITHGKRYKIIESFVFVSARGA